MAAYPKPATTVIGAYSVPDWYKSLTAWSPWVSSA